MSASPEIRDRVEALAAYGTPHKEIARVLRLDLDVLRGDYEEELATGRTKANSRVAEALYRTAIAGGREGVTAALKGAAPGLLSLSGASKRHGYSPRHLATTSTRGRWRLRACAMAAIRAAKR